MVSKAGINAVAFIADDAIREEKTSPGACDWDYQFRLPVDTHGDPAGWWWRWLNPDRSKNNWCGWEETSPGVWEDEYVNDYLRLGHEARVMPIRSGADREVERGFRRVQQVLRRSRPLPAQLRVRGLERLGLGGRKAGGCIHLAVQEALTHTSLERQSNTTGGEYYNPLKSERSRLPARRIRPAESVAQADGAWPEPMEAILKRDFAVRRGPRQR